MAKRNANYRRNQHRKDKAKEERRHYERKNVAERLKLARFKDRKRKAQNKADLDE